MDEDIKMLTDAGIDCSAGIARLGGNKAFFFRLLGKFIADKNYDNLIASYEQKDFENVLEYAHALKGLASNLAIDSVANPSTYINDKVKDGNHDIDVHIDELIASYANVIDAINGLPK